MNHFNDQNNNDNYTMWIILGLIALVAAALIWYLVYHSQALVPTSVQIEQPEAVAVAEEAVALDTITPTEIVDAVTAEELASTLSETAGVEAAAASTTEAGTAQTSVEAIAPEETEVPAATEVVPTVEIETANTPTATEEAIGVEL